MLDSWFREVPAYRIAAFRVVLATTTLCNYLPVRLAAGGRRVAGHDSVHPVARPRAAPGRRRSAGPRVDSRVRPAGRLAAVAVGRVPGGARHLRLRRREPLAQRFPAPAAPRAGRLLRGRAVAAAARWRTRHGRNVPRMARTAAAPAARDRVLPHVHRQAVQPGVGPPWPPSDASGIDSRPAGNRPPGARDRGRHRSCRRAAERGHHGRGDGPCSRGTCWR